jgi:hypothetical protein
MLAQDYDCVCFGYVRCLPDSVELGANVPARHTLSVGACAAKVLRTTAVTAPVPQLSSTYVCL